MLNFIALGCLEVTEKFQLPCNPNLGLDWIELGWKLGWGVTTKENEKEKRVEDANRGKPATSPQEEGDTFPGIKHKLTQEIKDKEQLYLQQRVKKHMSLETNLFREYMNYFTLGHWHTLVIQLLGGPEV